MPRVAVPVLGINGVHVVGGLRPRLGDDPLVSPTAPTEVQISEAGEITRGGVHVRRTDEGARGIESGGRRGHAQRVEQSIV